MKAWELKPGKLYVNDEDDFLYKIIPYGDLFVSRDKVNHEWYYCEESYNTISKMIFEEAIDWTNVPIDTDVICYFCGEQFKMYYAGLLKGKPSVWWNGGTSLTETERDNEWDRIEIYNE